MSYTGLTAAGAAAAPTCQRVCPGALGQASQSYQWYYAVATVPWRGNPPGFLGWLYTDAATAKYIAQESSVFSMVPMGMAKGWAWHPVMKGGHQFERAFKGWVWTSEWPASALTTGWGIHVFDAQGRRVT